MTTQSLAPDQAVDEAEKARLRALSARIDDLEATARELSEYLAVPPPQRRPQADRRAA